jgi:hypothetical protein
MPHTPRALLTAEVVGMQDVTGAHNTSDPERSQTCHLENWDSDKAWREITEHGGAFGEVGHGDWSGNCLCSHLKAGLSDRCVARAIASIPSQHLMS